MAELCLTLLCPPEIEEALLDLLLDRAGNEVFTSTPTHGHGLAAERLSASEQVSGRSRAVQVQVLLTPAELQQVRGALAAAFAGSGLRYWVTPVLEQGEFS